MVKKCRHPRDKWDRCDCVWLWDHREDGKRVYTPLIGVRTYAEAKERVHLRAGKRRSLTHRSPFKDHAYSWLLKYKPGPDNERRRNTYVTYRGYVRKLVAIFGEWRTCDIDGQTLGEFSRDLEQHYAATTASFIHSTMCSIIEHAGLTVPAHARVNGGKPRPRTPMTTTEVKSVIEAMPERTRAMAEFAVLSGLRLGELLGLRPEDREKDGVWVRRQRDYKPHEPWNPKTDSGTRFIVLGPRALSLLGDGEWCFPVSPGMAESDLRKAMKQVGVYTPGMGWHALRHFNATLRERGGMGLRGAQAALGHSNSTQTLSYGWGEQSPEEAAAVETYFQR